MPLDSSGSTIADSGRRLGFWIACALVALVGAYSTAVLVLWAAMAAGDTLWPMDDQPAGWLSVAVLTGVAVTAGAATYLGTRALSRRARA